MSFCSNLKPACCGDFKVTIPCTPTPSGLPLPGVPVVLDTIGINRFVLTPPTGSVEQLLTPRPSEKPSSLETISSIDNKTGVIMTISALDMMSKEAKKIATKPQGHFIKW